MKLAVRKNHLGVKFCTEVRTLQKKRRQFRFLDKKVFSTLMNFWNRISY